MLEKVVSEGKSKAVPVEGVEGGRACYPNSSVWGCIRPCSLGQ